MTTQQDFWKPKPYDFEAVVAGVDVKALFNSHRISASNYVQTKIRTPEGWSLEEIDHECLDRWHFDRSALSQAADIWDNRRKVATK